MAGPLRSLRIEVVHHSLDLARLKEIRGDRHLHLGWDFKAAPIDLFPAWIILSMLLGKNQTGLEVLGFLLFNDLNHIAQAGARLAGRVHIGGQSENSVSQRGHNP